MNIKPLAEICRIDACGKKCIARDLCSQHYQRWYKYGDPMFQHPRFGTGDTPEDRFWSKIGEPNAEGCREWKASLRHFGYGAAHLNGKAHSAHRLAWFYTYGTWPKQFLLHSCDNPKCCEVSHLREGSQQENMGDMVARGRQRAAKGESHRSAKLTDATVTTIRALYARGGVFQQELAAQFQVSVSTISRAINGTYWGHVA